MATTVHLPQQLLQTVDERASELSMSRNRYIILALEKAITEQTDWSSDFLDELVVAADDKQSQQLLMEMTEAIRSHRSRKAHPEL